VIAVPCGTQTGMAASCNVATEMRKWTKMFTIGGNPATTYKVKLHFCAVFEGRTYTGGMASAESARVYIGGMAANPNQYAATYPTLALKTADPMKTYYLNNAASVGEYSDKIMKFDYSATFEMKGGSSVVFESDGGSNGGIYTAYQAGAKHMCPMPPGIMTQPYLGQFVHMKVESTEPAQ
jgi:hypothetical protein